MCQCIAARRNANKQTGKQASGAVGCRKHQQNSNRHSLQLYGAQSAAESAAAVVVTITAAVVVVVDVVANGSVQSLLPYTAGILDHYKRTGSGSDTLTHLKLV